MAAKPNMPLQSYADISETQSSRLESLPAELRWRIIKQLAEDDDASALITTSKCLSADFMKVLPLVHVRTLLIHVRPGCTTGRWLEFEAAAGFANGRGGWRTWCISDFDTAIGRRFLSSSLTADTVEIRFHHPTKGDDQGGEWLASFCALLAKTLDASTIVRRLGDKKRLQTLNLSFTDFDCAEDGKSLWESRLTDLSSKQKPSVYVHEALLCALGAGLANNVVVTRHAIRPQYSNIIQSYKNAAAGRSNPEIIAACFNFGTDYTQLIHTMKRHYQWQNYGADLGFVISGEAQRHFQDIGVQMCVHRIKGGVVGEEEWVAREESWRTAIEGMSGGRDNIVILHASVEESGALKLAAPKLPEALGSLLAALCTALLREQPGGPVAEGLKAHVNRTIFSSSHNIFSRTRPPPRMFMCRPGKTRSGAFGLALLPWALGHGPEFEHETRNETWIGWSGRLLKECIDRLPRSLPGGYPPL
jgi:hypothetical protein